jgi:uncharacterized protein with FMN-binding domain
MGHQKERLRRLNLRRGLGFPVLLGCVYILSRGACGKEGDRGNAAAIESGTVHGEILTVQRNDKAASSGKEESPEGPQTVSNAFKDGKYTAESPGWTGMTVEVTVLKGKIQNIRILKAKGTPYFYKQVVEVLPKKIVDSGTPEIDGITGATLSSASLKDAVRAALGKAK